MIKAIVRVSGPTAPLQIVLDLPPYSTVQNLLDILATRCAELDAAFRLGLADHVIAVNGMQVTNRDQLVKEGGQTAEVTVLLIPPMVGG